MVMMERSLGDLPPDVGFLPPIVVDPRQHRTRRWILGALVGDEHHSARLCMLVGEDIKARTGLEVAIVHVLDHLFVPLHRPCIDGIA